jgi:hypothetical protein
MQKVEKVKQLGAALDDMLSVEKIRGKGRDGASSDSRRGIT